LRRKPSRDVPERQDRAPEGPSGGFQPLRGNEIGLFENRDDRLISLARRLVSQHNVQHLDQIKSRINLEAHGH
jgi:hypothetical protein